MFATRRDGSVSPPGSNTATTQLWSPRPQFMNAGPGSGPNAISRASNTGVVLIEVAARSSRQVWVRWIVQASPPLGS